MRVSLETLHQGFCFSFAKLHSGAHGVMGWSERWIARLLAWPLWSPASVSSESWTLYHSTAVLFTVLTALRVSKSWCFGDGLYLRRRILLLAKIRAFVQQWEAKCEAEISACEGDMDGGATSALTSIIGAEAAAVMVASWSGTTDSTRSASAGSSLAHAAANQTGFYGITTSIAFSSEVSLEEMLELAYVAPYVLYLDDDLAWLQRFARLLQYIVLRRVSLMEEVRLYSLLHRRVLFPRQARPTFSSPHTTQKHKDASLDFLQCSPHCAWRLHRRPTWLVPLSTTTQPPQFSSLPTLGGGAAAFACLPLCYFPVESVLPYTATDAWLSDRLLESLVPMWKKSCRHTLKTCAASLLRSDAVEEECAVRRQTSTACKISYWFLHLAEPLLRLQVKLHREAAQRFCTQRLYTLAYNNRSEYCDGQMGDKDANSQSHLRGGPLQLLWSCAVDSFTFPLRKRTNPCAVDEGCPTASVPATRFPLSSKVGSMVRRALLLRASTQAVSIILQVCLPRLSLRHLTEMVATGYCIDAATSSTSTIAVSPNARTAADGPSTVDALLRSLAAQMAWSTAAGMAEVFLQRCLGSLGGQLTELLSADITSLLEKNLLHVDEAFLQRWLRGSASASSIPSPHHSPSPPPALRTTATGSVFAQRPMTADDVLGVGRRSGEKVLAAHDAVVRWWLRCAVLGARAVLTRQWRPLLGAVATAWVDVPKATAAVSVLVGYSLPHDVARLLARREESLPTRSPAGLRLLLEVLVEDAETRRSSVDSSRLHKTASCANSDAPNSHKQRAVAHHKGRSACHASLSHPYLALVVCSSVWNFDYLLGEPHRQPEKLSALVRGVRRLHTTVAAHAFAARKTAKLSARAAGVVAALQDDARCIAHYPLYQIEQHCRAQGWWTDAPLSMAGKGPPDKTTMSLHPLLDAEETRLLQTPSVIAYLPEHVDYFDLFSLPYRFILRQLGLEMVFAYRTAAGMQQDSRQMAEEWWTLTLFNSTFNPLTSALQEVVQLAAACATVLLLRLHVQCAAPVLRLEPVSLSSFVQASHTISVYREVLRAGVAVRRLEDNLCPAQQLCEWLPRTIWSEQSLLQTAATEHSSAGYNGYESVFCAQQHSAFPLPVESTLQRRRREWRRHLARCRPELIFDHEDRVVGGLRLREGVRWHHVNFCYPQLLSPKASLTASAKANSDACAAHQPAARPALSDLNFLCPSHGMTAVIGPSGAGKSSLTLLLRRLYDPVPVLWSPSPCCEGSTHAPCRGNNAVNLDHVGMRGDALKVLQEVLHLALVENALPAPPSATSYAPSPDWQVCKTHDLLLQPGYLALDGVPLSVFSTGYVRQWLAWLPQTPVLLPQLSFLRNVSVLSEAVTLTDVLQALQLCNCDDFIKKKQRTVHDCVGPLSGGEGQRLALARVVASVYARRRLEVIHSCALDDEASEGKEGEGASRVAAAVGGIVLDEPTSRLDAANELRLLASLTNLRGSDAVTPTDEADTVGAFSDELPTTRSDTVAVGAALPLFTWMISHRMSSLRAATFMVVVEDGTVTAAGPPHEVLQGNSFAKAQWQHQRLRGGEEEEKVEEQGKF